MDGTPSIVHKTRPHKKIWFPPQINQPLTSVVEETIRISLRIVSQGQKENITVTYDFAIAKLALQIQAEEKLTTFDEIIISLGCFHLEMAIFSVLFFVLGKTIEESSGPNILDDCKILMKGSINSFLIRKAINDVKECISF